MTSRSAFIREQLVQRVFVHALGSLQHFAERNLSAPPSSNDPFP
jgi:hypothetical protein